MEQVREVFVGDEASGDEDADHDGAVCVPRDKAPAVLDRAKEIQRQETAAAILILEGQPLRESLAAS